MRCLLIFCSTISFISARIHEFRIEDDSRSQIQLSTFGFLAGGKWHVHLTNFTVGNLEADKTKAIVERAPEQFGFTIDRTDNSGMSTMIRNQKVCDRVVNSKKDIFSDDVIYLQMDINTQSLMIEKRSENVQNVRITPLVDKTRNFHANHKIKRSDPVSSCLDENHKQVAVGERFINSHNQECKCLEDGKTVDCIHVRRDIGVPDANDLLAEPSSPSTKSASCIDSRNHIHITGDPYIMSNSSGQFRCICGGLCKNVIPFKTTQNNSFEISFQVFIPSQNEAGLYDLFFHNCITGLRISFDASIIEVNGNVYLSAGEAIYPQMYSALFFVFFVAGCLWAYVLYEGREHILKIHYLMLLLVFIKSFTCLFHAVNYYYISKEGIHEMAWAVMFYITYLLRGGVLFITLLLIGTGWSSIKHFLSEKEKKIFAIVIPLQVLANIAYIIFEEKEESAVDYKSWQQMLFLVDLVCCGAILFPIMWSIKHLKQAANVDGKAHNSLQMLKIFKHLYIIIICYLYFTRIIVYFLQATVPFNYSWVVELCKQFATLLFYTLTAYKFQPKENNPYFGISQESDDEAEPFIKIDNESDEDVVMDAVTMAIDKSGTTLKYKNRDNSSSIV